MSRTAHPAQSRSAARRRRVYQRRRILGVFVLLSLVLVMIWLFPAVASPVSPAEAGQPAMAPAPETSAPVLQLRGQSGGTAQLGEVWIYGTHLGLRGTLPWQGEAPARLLLVLRTETGEESSWPLQAETAGGTLSFGLGEVINGGLELEALAEQRGGLLLQAADAAGTLTEYPLTAGSAAGDFPLTYYTVTRGGANRCITIQQADMQWNDSPTQALQLDCTAATLPDGVYDVMIDPGHGGDDGGTINGDHTEADIALDIALRTQRQLQALGLKVGLTRDGSEGNLEHMAFRAYDPDGRVNVISGSGAKVCLSLHLNSYEGALDEGGVQIYAADRMDYSFAAALARNIAQSAGANISSMVAYSLGNGVYCRTFTQEDVDGLLAEGQRKGFSPYQQPVGTNYYYILRETGGRATGAYIDGRNPDYGENYYRDSPVGVECYLCELGYISVDQDLHNLVNNPDAYAAGLAQAICERFGLE